MTRRRTIAAALTAAAVLASAALTTGVSVVTAAPATVPVVVAAAQATTEQAEQAVTTAADAVETVADTAVDEAANAAADAVDEAGDAAEAATKKKSTKKTVVKKKATKKKSTAAKPAPNPVAPAPAASLSAVESRIVALTNAQRAANGCGALRVDARLTAAARAFSADMAAHNYFSHTGRDGSSFVTRTAAAGYTAAGAENIAWGYRTADEVVTGWMNSEGHRRNILNCSLVAVGVGVGTKADGTPYYTQDFGRA